MANRKVVYVVLDGLADEHHPDLDRRTPLRAARTANLDMLARRGRTASVAIGSRASVPEASHTVLALLNYDVEAPRGSLEASGAGLGMRQGDLAWRANFGTADENGYLLDRRAGRDLDEASKLAEACAGIELDYGGSEARFVSTGGHRAVLHLRADNALSAAVSSGDAAYGGTGDVRALESVLAAQMAAEMTNDWLRKARTVLEDHPINSARMRRGALPGNTVLVRGCGDAPIELDALEQRCGLRFACIASQAVVLGVAHATGMHAIAVPDAGTDASANADLAGRCVEALDSWDGVFVHLKAADIASLDGDAFGKVAAIEAIDEGFLGTLLPELNRGVVVAVTSDHATSTIRRTHITDPVPLVVAGGLISPDGSRSFDEEECSHGSLRGARALEILPLLITAARE